MTPPLKATLISALVFPGGGHFYLKKPFLGALLTGISLVCIYLLLSTAMEAAQVISLKIQSGEIPLDVMRIREEIYKQTAASGSTTTEVATWLLVACWLVGIADSFRLGRQQEQARQKPDPSQPS
ncbi:MAG: hypothetical protein GY815_13130 [Gammaproteobacteria bacterium]|nr:hypothetical protein [Gammaproteobacteria bacterium]